MLIDGWDLVITHLTPKSILSRKPLSMKNQKAILLFKADTNQHIPSLMPALKIVLITLLQQNRLVELYGNTSATVILTAEEEEIKKLFVAQYNLMASTGGKVQSNFSVNTFSIDRIISYVQRNVKAIDYTAYYKPTSVVQDYRD